jgi:hypothetical protein
MKKLILTGVLTLLFAISSHATGYIQINCKSQNAQIIFGHFGFKGSLVVQQLIYGAGIPHQSSTEYRSIGNDISITADGVQFYLRGVFNEIEPSYPTPTLEIRTEEFPFSSVIEKGSCELN